MSEGITSDLFCGVLKLLCKIHGERVPGPAINCFVENLNVIEQAYLSLPLASPKRKRTKKEPKDAL